MMNTFGYDCLYYHEDELLDPASNKIPFCLRPDSPNLENDQDRSCNGQRIPIEYFKTTNVTTDDLFYWNAEIELYEKYLVSIDLVVDEDEYYCNCSLLTRFDHSCEYDINESIQRKLTLLLWDSRSHPLDDEIHNDYFICYIGIRCSTRISSA